MSTGFPYPFRSSWGHKIFQQKYAHEGCETWEKLAATITADVCEGLLSKSECDAIEQHIAHMRFIPGGRYLYYAGRRAKFFNNCYLLRAEEDTRQDWANLSWKAESALMTGGGIGVDYSVYRGKGSPLGRTGGEASGPIPKIQMINEIGRNVMQGGSRRSALYASLNWQHSDAPDFLTIKDWKSHKIPGTNKSIWDVRQKDFNYPAALDMTNISLNYDDAWLGNYNASGDISKTFRKNVDQAARSGEPGFSFNFGKHTHETLRNACCEITSEDDSDACCLGSVNISRIESLDQFIEVCRLATLFLLCGTHRSDVPYDKVAKVREQNRRLGVGLMGIHEWLLSRGKRYEVGGDLGVWLEVYERTTDAAAIEGANRLGCERPKGVRAIAPTGTIGILAGTTGGIEPIFGVAYKRRYLKGRNWQEEVVIDDAAKMLIDKGVDPDTIETALDLAGDPERRIKFQYDVQRFVDHAISSTLNLPAWGTPLNNEDTVDNLAHTIAKYAHGLRGLTMYPDAARGGQPLSLMSYSAALKAQQKAQKKVVTTTHDACEIGGKGGTCGL